MSYITMKEGEGEYHKCTKCLRMYGNKESLENHMQRKHSIDENISSLPSEASTFGSVIQSTLQRRRDKARGPAGSASRAQTLAPQGGTSSPRVGARPGVPTVHEQPSVKVGSWTMCARLALLISEFHRLWSPKRTKKRTRKRNRRKGSVDSTLRTYQVVTLQEEDTSHSQMLGKFEYGLPKKF